MPAGTRTIEDHVSAPVPLRLRPLEIGDVLDETFRLYRRNFLLLAGLSVGFSIPLAAFAGYGYSALFGELFNQASSSNPGDFTTFAPALAALATGVVIRAGKNKLLFPKPTRSDSPRDGPIYCHERLGGHLKFYSKEAA